MLLFPLLRTLDDTITPDRCKIHLAIWNGFVDPLDVFFAGEFDEWQSWQSKKNFRLELVLSLIALAEPNRWLFAGVHDVHSCTDTKRRTPFYYHMTRRKSTDILLGRLVVDFERTGRQSYLLAKHWECSLGVASLYAEPLEIEEFPGYTSTKLTKQKLDVVVRQQNPTWKSALSSVSGVYVISDRSTGKMYVGSAIGDSGIWGRWCEYSATGHGGNRELKALLRKKGTEYAENFIFGILETADTRTSDDEILQRESHWKELLLTRTHGYNAN